VIVEHDKIDDLMADQLAHDIAKKSRRKWIPGANQGGGDTREAGRRLRQIMATLSVGITGGIGSGKTEACRIFESLGAAVFSADLIARELIDKNDAIRKKISKTFGSELYTPAGLDRKRMAQLVFRDESLQEELNAIVHPAVLLEMERLIKEAKARRSGPLIVIEAALIFESGAERMLDFVIAVDAPADLRTARVMARDKSSRVEAHRRIRSQTPSPTINRKADFVIRNTAGLDELERKCSFLYALLCRIADAGNTL